MNKQLELLIEIQKLDSLIIEKTMYIYSIPKKLSSLEKSLNDTESLLKKEQQDYESILKKKREKERDLEDINEKVNKLKARTSEIKTNKEYQAHLKEIESKERERINIEDNILLLMEEIEKMEAKVEFRRLTLAEEQKKVGVEKKKLEEETRHEEEEVTEIKAERSRIVTQLEPDLYSLYMNLLSSLKGLAVTKAEDEVCIGCNMNIPPQLYVEVKKNDDIIQCPQCKRVLYYIEKIT